MWGFLRKQLLTVLVGFALTFVIYLFVRFDATKVIEGIVIAVAAGLLLATIRFVLERRFPDQTPGE